MLFLNVVISKAGSESLQSLVPRKNRILQLRLAQFRSYNVLNLRYR
jgi:hypothetical protein